MIKRTGTSTKGKGKSKGKGKTGKGGDADAGKEDSKENARTDMDIFDVCVKEDVEEGKNDANLSTVSKLTMVDSSDHDEGVCGDR